MGSINHIIGQNISKLRKEIDITQAELAEKLNYSDKAVSKWERGESVPDVSTLVSIADFFGVTLNELCYDTTLSKRESISQKKKTRHAYITILSVGLCWLVATITFAMLLVYAPSLTKKWLAFIYAIPVSGIILVVFNNLWGKRIWNTLFVSMIVWGILISICLTADSANTNWLYIIGIPLQLLTIVWYLFKSKIIEKIRYIKKSRSKKQENEKIS